MNIRSIVSRRAYAAKIILGHYGFLDNKTRVEKKLKLETPVLLDTSLKTDNAGDNIIMHFCQKQLDSIWPGYSFPRYPTHGRRVDMPLEFSNCPKILCGTNALTTEMEIDLPVAFPLNPDVYHDSVVLMAVGLRYVHGKKSFTPRTASFLNKVLSHSAVHSVRDENTRRCLREIGFDNVINTSCVTMWALTPELCSSIPTKKAANVLTTITDYDRDEKNDRFMLETLCEHYENVYVWIQGLDDREYLESLVNTGDYRLVEGGFKGLEAFISSDAAKDLDYLGTRLHCGIYCINHGIRSTIVAVDNRAVDIHEDTGLRIVMREDLADKLSGMIEEDFETKLDIPFDRIERWKSQFPSYQAK